MTVVKRPSADWYAMRHGPPAPPDQLFELLEDVGARRAKGPTCDPALLRLCTVGYLGELSASGLYEGNGMAVFKQGYKYLGVWNGGLMPQGAGHRGRIEWHDGLSYEGDILNNVPEGRGTFTYPNGDTYEGEVSRGLRHGKGTYTCYETGDAFTGDWLRGVKHGKGVLVYYSGARYDGDWREGRKEGRGRMTWASGSEYEGEWAGNVRMGTGRMVWRKNGVVVAEYSGGWMDGCPQGQGTQTYHPPAPVIHPAVQGSEAAAVSALVKAEPARPAVRLNRFTGNFLSGARHGYGCFYYDDGATYEGYWDHNTKHGAGKFLFANGSCFAGDFVDGHPAAGDIQASRGDQRHAFEIPLFIDDLLVSEQNRDDVLVQVSCILSRHYGTLRRVYDHYSSLAVDGPAQRSPVGEPQMTMLQFWKFVKDTGLAGTDLNLAAVDRIFLRFRDSTQTTAVVRHLDPMPSRPQPHAEQMRRSSVDSALERHAANRLPPVAGSTPPDAQEEGEAVTHTKSGKLLARGGSGSSMLPPPQKGAPPPSASAAEGATEYEPSTMPGAVASHLCSSFETEAQPPTQRAPSVVPASPPAAASPGMQASPAHKLASESFLGHGISTAGRQKSVSSILGGRSLQAPSTIAAASMRTAASSVGGPLSGLSGSLGHNPRRTGSKTAKTSSTAAAPYAASGLSELSPRPRPPAKSIFAEKWRTWRGDIHQCGQQMSFREFVEALVRLAFERHRRLRQLTLADKVDRLIHDVRPYAGSPLPFLSDGQEVAEVARQHEQLLRGIFFQFAERSFGGLDLHCPRRTGDRFLTVRQLLVLLIESGVVEQQADPPEAEGAAPAEAPASVGLTPDKVLGLFSDSNPQQLLCPVDPLFSTAHNPWVEEMPQSSAPAQRAKGGAGALHLTQQGATRQRSFLGAKNTAGHRASGLDLSRGMSRVGSSIGGGQHSHQGSMISSRPPPTDDSRSDIAAASPRREHSPLRGEEFEMVHSLGYQTPADSTCSTTELGRYMREERVRQRQKWLDNISRGDGGFNFTTTLRVDYQLVYEEFVDALAKVAKMVSRGGSAAACFSALVERHLAPLAPAAARSPSPPPPPAAAGPP